MNVAAAFTAVSIGDVETFQDVQTFMATLCVTGLLMGSVVSELRNEKAKLDLRVRSRTRDLIEEIDRRQRAEDIALQEKQRAESYLAIAQPVIIAVDRDARITLVNNSAIRLFGSPRAELLGRDWIEILGLGMGTEAGTNHPGLRSIHRALFADKPVEIPNFETRLRGRDGAIRVIDWRSALIHSSEGRVHGILCSGDDITERVAAEEKLRYLASHDPVTGLHNRNWLLDHFPRATARARRHETLLAVLFIDLTGFKQINDVYGHAHGDRILIATAARLKQCVRETDAVTRLGGDEFVVLLEDVGAFTGAVHIAEKMLRTIAEPLRVDDDTVAVGASIGIAFYPHDGKTSEELLSRADAAMYLAKRHQAHGYRLAPGHGGAPPATAMHGKPAPPLAPKPGIIPARTAE
jgi:diguanylate cyclase (GGDEF)-like protein/PAS domain S-box-containing protein